MRKRNLKTISSTKKRLYPNGIYRLSRSANSKSFKHGKRIVAVRYLLDMIIGVDKDMNTHLNRYLFIYGINTTRLTRVKYIDDTFFIRTKHYLPSIRKLEFENTQVEERDNYPMR